VKITKQRLTKLVREELKEYDDEAAYPMPEFTPEEQKVRDLIDEMVKAVEAMGKSNPDMTDDYIYLFRALEKAGLKTEWVSKMSY
jgi:hypothetical protein